MENLSEAQIKELFNIRNNMPVFDAGLLSGKAAQELIEMGLATNEPYYVLTERGKRLLLDMKIEFAKEIAAKSVLSGTGGGEI